MYQLIFYQTSKFCNSAANVERMDDTLRARTQRNFDTLVVKNSS
jgi:hypothetical protein